MVISYFFARWVAVTHAAEAEVTQKDNEVVKVSDPKWQRLWPAPGPDLMSSPIRQASDGARRVLQLQSDPHRQTKRAERALVMSARLRGEPCQDPLSLLRSLSLSLSLLWTILIPMDDINLLKSLQTSGLYRGFGKR